MYLPSGVSINDKNHLELNGKDFVDLARKYSTPLYLMNEDLIRSQCRVFKDAMSANFDKYRIYYASKAFSCKYIYKLMQEENIGADVVSGGEIYTALSAGFDPSNLCFHGNCKTRDELKLALESNVGRIVVDNVFELEELSALAVSMNKKVNIYFRIKPGIEAHTHSSIMTGQIDSKFGFALENGEAREIVSKAISTDNICLKGLHCHIGSQIFEAEPFVRAASVMMKFIADIKNETGYEIDELDLGGGFGIKYVESDNPPEPCDIIKKVADEIKDSVKRYNIKMPEVIIEPGRSIVGEAGITLYRAGSVKEIKNIRKYVAVDGGMTDNPRYALYESEYTAMVANKADEPANDKVTIAGKCCESGDLIGKDMMIQKVQVGDIIAVFSTGAYNYSMASNYNRIPRPAAVAVSDKCDKVIINRETYEDIIKNDRM